MNATELIVDYHERTKHRPERYAAGPETLDWDAQPNPFRRWAGAPLTPLPLVAHTLPARWDDLFVPGRVPVQPVGLWALGALFELSFALTAWKQQGPDRWALRANPSSGNLHPTEAYLLTSGVTGLADGLYHYAPREHALEQRTASPAAAHAPPRLWVGLSSVQWREVWKYGERAFRYCQLDTGHALGALRHAAATLGWQARVVSGVDTPALAALLGLDRDADFGAAEREEPELLVQIGPPGPDAADAPVAWPPGQAWHGQANRLDAHPMYRWPVIDQVAQATRAVPPLPVPLSINPPINPLINPPLPASHGLQPAAQVIQQRRSAQHFDRRGLMPVDVLYRLLAACLPGAGLPWDAWPEAPRVHLVVFAHRVDGLAPGAYLLPRSQAGAALLARHLLNGTFELPLSEAPAHLPLHRMAEHPALAGTLRTLSCHQAIASDACVAFSLLAEFDGPLDAAPAHYRTLYQEAGLLGQVLYLQAEAEGLRGTGIGCYFDDAVHQLLGLQGSALQALYHFTVGVPVHDSRITTEAPYAGRAPVAAAEPDWKAPR